MFVHKISKIGLLSPIQKLVKIEHNYFWFEMVSVKSG